MPANTVLKLRAGTQAAWVATAKTKTVASAIVVGTTNTVARYTSTAHTFAVGNVVTITGITVVSGNNPYNIDGGVISAVTTDTFDIKITDGTTGGVTNASGSAVLVVLAKGEAAVETDTNRLKIGDGETTWGNLDYVNKSLFYVLNSAENIAGTSNEQNLFDNKFSLKESSSYSFEIQAIILCATTTARTLKFGFEQTGMTAWADVRYQWTYGTRENGTIHYATEAKTITGNSPSADGLIQLGPITDGTDDVIFFNIKGIIRTNAGASFFQPRIQFSNSPGTGTTILSGSYINLDLIGDSPFVNPVSWVSN
jgi:hypothetical protein